MAQNFKRLGAISPSANTQTNVYVVPAATEAVISTITICNQNASNVLYSLIVMPPGSFSATANTADFVVRDVLVPSLDTIILTIGLTGNAGTVFAANTSNTNVSFSMFGSEIN
jgi:hypothetical protein